MILITGSTGFVGAHVLKAFRRSVNEDQIRLLVPESELSTLPGDMGVQIMVGDLGDENALEKSVSGIRTIVHLASKNIDHDSTGFDSVNVEGTRLLCQAAGAGGVKKVIYLSSVGVYGHRRFRNADETTPVRPDTAFSRSKADAEELILDYHRRKEITAVILRHRFIWGEGDRHFIPRILSAINKYPFLIGGGRAKISLILIEDLADIIVRFAREKSNRAAADPVYHVTDGEPVSYHDIVDTLCQSYELNPPEKAMPFWPLYVPIRLLEKIRGADPETTKSSLSSIRLKLVGIDNYFTNDKLLRHFDDLSLTPFVKAFNQNKDYYKELKNAQ